MIGFLIVLAAMTATPDGIGYSSAPAALEALKARGGVTISEGGGWTTVDDKVNGTLWSFTLPGHPAHPAAVRRTVVMENG
ncbi:MULTISPECIES: hypothetical protein [unclassified Duganella]|uniref:hypothetical protein n=1 Tax=unclassified Duganella TaxID=2636909 RepID=UPI0006F31AE0|nr:MULTISPECIES: hypothetical protein [unclassified Duganella]KQV45275.1 hypothetical protein ASD07_17280 [Duganella sp. Root336D2]KRC02807.1 hypothetical protein ASE26_16480 [Duganella sp. Root198D2]